ncbi:MAG: FAD-binding protein [Clostridiaceae bacterium]|nr:FAD-binding protein [Clostridiaceae bacterium]
MSKNYSRRTFLKGAAASAISVAALGVVGCSKEEPAVQQEQTVKEELAVNQQPVVNKVETNLADDWLGKAPEIDDSEVSSTLDTDLLIVGAGNGGLMAAATAADANMDFIICEQNTIVGDTRYWVGAVDTDAMKEAGVTVQKDRILNELARYASYKCNMDLIKMWIDNSAEMISYLENLGGTAVVNVENGNHVGGNNMEYYVPSVWHTINVPEDSPYATPMGMQRNLLLADYIADKGHEIKFSMSLVKLTQDSSKNITGAIFTNENDEYVKINAKNVILATGGYPGNPKMIKALAPIVEKCVTASSYFARNTGMGIKAGIWAGAEMDAEPAPMIFDRGLVAPGVKAGYVDDGKGNLKFPGTVYQFNLGTQPMLKVNKEGKRFANESCPYDFFNFAASLQTDGVYAAIFDSDIVDDVLTYDQYGCAKISVDMANAGALMDSINKYVDDGLIFRCDTIDELADKLGIPSDTLNASVKRYNELCDKGVDEDYGKEAYRMRSVDKAPYYGCFFGGTLLTTCDGLRINEKCQVYDTEHKIIEGLYCIGDCSGSFYANNYPEYIVGNAIGRTLTQGRMAIKVILGEV